MTSGKGRGPDRDATIQIEKQRHAGNKPVHIRKKCISETKTKVPSDRITADEWFFTNPMLHMFPSRKFLLYPGEYITCHTSEDQSLLPSKEIRNQTPWATKEKKKKTKKRRPKKLCPLDVHVRSQIGGNADGQTRRFLNVQKCGSRRRCVYSASACKWLMRDSQRAVFIYSFFSYEFRDDIQTRGQSRHPSLTQFLFKTNTRFFLSLWSNADTVFQRNSFRRPGVHQQSSQSSPLIWTTAFRPHTKNNVWMVL